MFLFLPIIYLTFKEGITDKGLPKGLVLSFVRTIDNDTTYHYEEDISINIENDYIIREYIIRECPQFNFYESDSEETYKLYENGDRTILLKEYNKYCSFEINTNNKDIKI